MLVFRSVVVSLKAALVTLSIGGAYGVLVAVFQWAWLEDLVGLEGRCRPPRKGCFITFFAP